MTSISSKTSEAIQKNDRIFLYYIEKIVDKSKNLKIRDKAKQELDDKVSNISKRTFTESHLGGMEGVAFLKWEQSKGKNNYTELLLAKCYLKIALDKAKELVQAAWKKRLADLENSPDFVFTQEEVAERLSDRLIEVESRIKFAEEKTFPTETSI